LPRLEPQQQVVTLDLEAADGLAAAKALVAGADVAILDVPGVLERLGLDGKTLTAEHPGLVHAWMPPFRTEGRWSRCRHGTT
jgi:crotonobetainyl-CoA:carnitine CoA-transferase CaiB-like acyl-CoA transferase